MKGVQCYELFGGIALKNHTFSSKLRSIFLPIRYLTNGHIECTRTLFPYQFYCFDGLHFKECFSRHTFCYCVPGNVVLEFVTT